MEKTKVARRKDHSREELKEMILDAAWNIVSEEGISNLTARSLGDRIGYVAGTIYNIFPSMEVLHLHLNARTMDMLYAKLDKISDKDSGALEKNLFQLAQGYIAFSEKYRQVWVALFSMDLQSFKENYPWYEEKIRNIFIPLEKILGRGLPGKYTSQIKEDSYVLWSSVHGLTYLWVTGKASHPDFSTEKKGAGKKNLERNIKLLISTYVAGISVRKKG